MPGYGAISLSNPDDNDGKGEINFIPKWVVSFFEGVEDLVSCQREKPTKLALLNESSTLKFKVNPESCRFIAWCFFWSMSFFAIAMTNFFVRPQLLNGPEVAGSTCPPFDVLEGQIDRSMGFDIKTESHLKESFGFNNICSNWDYSPSRELTAMVYPLFEYSLLIYIILDFTLATISYKKGYVSARYWTAAMILFPVQIILCAWFRMIFVVLAYENVRGHTAGFLGLQIALIIVAILNTAYVLETKVSYSFLGGLRGTRITAFAYIIGNLIIGSIKVYFTTYIVFGLGGDSLYPEWGLQEIAGSGLVVGQVVDIFWMIFNAILPVIISGIRAGSEPPLEFTIDLKKPNFVE